MFWRYSSESRRADALTLPASGRLRDSDYNQVGDMFAKALFLVALLVKLSADDEDSSFARKQEKRLISALKARDEITLATLTDGSFHVQFAYGSVVRHFDADVARKAWIADVTDAQIESYQGVISKIAILNADSMSATLHERWTLRAAGHPLIERHFISEDTWLRKQGVWKLAARISQVDPL